MTLTELDAAVAGHMQHGAMAGCDPLSDSLHQQLECAAVEGGNHPPPPCPLTCACRRVGMWDDEIALWRWLGRMGQRLARAWRAHCLQARICQLSTLLARPDLWPTTDRTTIALWDAQLAALRCELALLEMQR